MIAVQFVLFANFEYFLIAEVTELGLIGNFVNLGQKQSNANWKIFTR